MQKQRAFQYGILNLAGVNAAKVDLKKQGYDASLIPQMVITFSLNEEEKKELEKSCIKKKDNENQRQKKNTRENEEKKGQEQFNSDFNDKYQAAFDFDAKVQVSCENNKVDPAGYYEFLISSSKQDLTFLQVIAKIIEVEEMEKQKLRLFLALCGLCTNKEVYVDANLQDSMLNYLATEPKVLPRQTSGFFKLSFLNEVGISTIFNTGIIKKFDKRFANNFDDFWERLVGNDSISKRVFSNLPQTCLVLSLPMIRALKDCSVFHGIFPEHLKYLLTIFVYSFPTDHSQFKFLLSNIKQTTKTDIERMKASQFQQFLDTLTTGMLAYNERWFRNYNAVHILLTGVLQLISLNKVPGSCFSKQICDELIHGSITIEELLDRPAQLSQECNIEDATRSRLNNLEACNSNLFFKRILAAQQIEYSNKLLTPFNIKNIELKPEQQIFMSLCQSEQQLLLCTGAGVGKTTFLGGLVLSIALTNKDPILIINQNKRLLNRDFQDVIDWSQMIHGLKALTISQYTESQMIEQITFMTPQELTNAILPCKFHIVVDELQLLFTKDIIPLVPLFEAAQSFVGVTGSPMPNNYRQMLEILLPDACIANFPDEYKWNTTERDVVFVSTITQQLKEIDNIYKQQRQSTPLLCIMSKDLITAYKKHDSKRQWVTFMDELSDADFNLVLKEQFTLQKNSFYGCYVVTETEGVGIEYPSTPTIDKNGGVVVCICAQPESYSDLAQWKRRTGRIGRPGVVQFVFQGKKDVGSQNYMKFLEKKLLKKEEKAVRELKAFLKIELNRDEPIDSDSEIEYAGENNEEGKVQQVEGNQQQNIGASLLQQKQGEDVCKKGCGKSIHIGKCQTNSSNKQGNEANQTQKQEVKDEEQMKKQEEKEDLKDYQDEQNMRTNPMVCLTEHTLLHFTMNPKFNGVCNACDNAIAEAFAWYNCSACQFDFCGECYKQRNKDDVPQNKEAAGIMSPLQQYKDEDVNKDVLCEAEKDVQQYIERIKVVGDDGVEFYAELSDFTQFKSENLELNQETLVKELKASMNIQRKEVQKQHDKESLAKALAPVNIGTKTVTTTNAFARMSVGENDETPAKDHFRKSSEILASLKQEGQKKKFMKDTANGLGYVEGNKLREEEVLGKRSTRASNLKEQQGNKKQRLSQLKDKQITHETNKNKMTET